MPQFYKAPSLSPWFKSELLRFYKIKAWENKHILAFTELMINEAIYDTTYTYDLGFEAQPDKLCQFYGPIDFFLY